ncbi:MAG: ABC transporter ATP-binding protein [bacterium]
MYPYIKPYIGRFIIAVLVTIPIGSLDAAIAFSLRPYMNEVMINQSLKNVSFIPILIISFTMVQGILNYFSTYLNGWLGQKITNNIKQDLYNKLLNFESAYFDKSSSGAMIAKFSSDPENASAGFLNNIKIFFTRFFASISLIIVLIYNSWQLAIIAITVLLLTLLPLSESRKRIKKTSESILSTGGILLTHYNETFAGNKLIASYNLSNHLAEKFKFSLKEYFNLNMKITRLNSWLTPSMHIIASIGIAAVIGYGSQLILTKQITGGAFVSFVVALIMLYNPVKGMGSIALATQMSFLAMGRIFDLLDYTPKIQNKENPVLIKSVENSINFENVWFEYDKDCPVLRNINLEIKTGETIALVGNSGGGKSSMVSLIPRFYDVTEGRITLDGINIKDIELNSLREKIAVVLQDNFLFEGTIRENILLGKLDAADEELEKAVKDAYLDDFVSDLSQGLDTKIGERGVLLSGGQKQRIAIARALLKNAPIVILDEATSALDNKSEAIVQKAIDKLMKNRTVFVIAHRLSTVQNASKIVVINDGAIVEIGNHENLIAKEKGIYKSLYFAQFKPQRENLAEIIS